MARRRTDHTPHILQAAEELGIELGREDVPFVYRPPRPGTDDHLRGWDTYQDNVREFIRSSRWP